MTKPPVNPKENSRSRAKLRQSRLRTAAASGTGFNEEGKPIRGEGGVFDMTQAGYKVDKYARKR